jgi:transposase
VVPQCRLIYDKFHVMQHANEAVTEVRRAEFFRKGGAARQLIKAKRWLLLTRWVHLNTNKKRQLNQLFAINRRVMKAYPLKESLDRLWNYTYEGALLRYLQSWIDQLLAATETDGETSQHVAQSSRGHFEPQPDEGTDGRGGSHQRNIKALLPRGRGYRDLDYLLLKAQR